jgi:hypothetical protein
LARNPTWSRDELILAMDLYVRNGWLDDRHPEVIALSALLNRLAETAPTPTYRNPNGVSMKLANFRSIDPDHLGAGLRGAGRNDRAVWEEFTQDRDRLAREALAIRIRILDRDEDAEPESDELADAEDAIDELAGRPSKGQGFRVSTDGRLALEAFAMELAERHYRAAGWQVENVSARASYDLLCTRPGHDELHVEVKGTQSDGRQILLTRNEVLHAKEAFPGVALFIVARIELYRDAADQVAARGGQPIVLDPWSLNEEGLSPLAFAYRLE